MQGSDCQRLGQKFLKTDFKDELDTLVLDLGEAYEVDPLKKLHRTFNYSRQKRGNSP